MSVNQFSWIAFDDFGPIRYSKYRHQAEDYKAATGCSIKATGTPEPIAPNEYDSAMAECGPCLF